jgi:hypothetical protein
MPLNSLLRSIRFIQTAILAVTIALAPRTAPGQELSSDAGGQVSLPVLGYDMARPATIPLDFVPTPNGWFHPSCVIEVREDEEVRGLAIRRPDGTMRAIQRCGYPHYDRHGKAIVSDTFDPTVNGWVAYASAYTPAVEWLSATWAVPTAPPSNIGQTLYFFPGLERAVNADTILQPVLAWNGLYAPAGWAIYSWNCCRNGNTIYSTPVAASSGETISGYAWGTNCDPGTGVCNNWQIRASSTYSSSTLSTDAYGEALGWVFGGAVEIYNVTSCNQYPASQVVAYQNVTARQVGGAALAPTWSTYLIQNLSPNCMTGAQASGTNVTMQWCVPRTCAGECGTISDGCGGTLNCGTCDPYGGCGTSQKCCEPGTTSCDLCWPKAYPCP